LVLVLSTGRVYGWEQDVTRNLEAVPGRTLTFEITSTLTNPSSVFFISFFLAVTAFIARRGEREAAMLLLLSFPLHLLVEVPRALVARPSPSSDFDGITGVGGFDSFPSAPAEYVITFYGFLAYLLILRYTRERQRNIILWSWVAFALATGFSGIAEGYHWPLDVVASYIAGLGLLSGLIWLHEGFRAARAEHAAATAEETADFVVAEVRRPIEPAGDPESHPTPRP
jgi:membrane-associated phospholipid phosphatase